MLPPPPPFLRVFWITLNHLGRAFYRSHLGSFIPLIVVQFLCRLCASIAIHCRKEAEVASSAANSAALASGAPAAIAFSATDSSRSFSNYRSSAFSARSFIFSSDFERFPMWSSVPFLASSIGIGNFPERNAAPASNVHMKQSLCPAL